MKNLFRHLLLSCCGVLAAVGLVTLSGCDTQSANALITIAPSSIVAHRGDAITFTADGGFEYHWELSDHVYGVLSNTHGRQTTYTVINEPADTDVVVVLSVTSTITGAGQGENNAAYEATGEAYIRVASATGGAAADVLRVDPAEVTLGPNDTQVFTASGGSGAYAWVAVQGGVSPTTGGQVTYTAPDYDTNGIPNLPDAVTVTDGNNNVAVATVNLQ